MTQPMTATSTVQATDCWTNFTNMCTTAMRALAKGVMKVWNAIKAAVMYVYTSAAPLANRAVQWAKTNQQTAAIVGLVAATATAVGVYFYCCKSSTTTTVDPSKTPDSTKKV
jgi:formate-dependent nitrite reductase membrane component NrfD